MAEAASILVVDDDVALGQVLTALLQQAGLRASAVVSADAALAVIAAEPVDLVISDVRMPGLDGMQLLAQIVQRHPDLPVVMLTAHGTIPLAVEAMRAGAADFVLKPFDREEILYTVHKALARAPQAPPGAAGAQGLVGESAVMSELQEMIDRAARSDATVLVRGESGTGKELVAHALHDRGRRRGGPFVTVHCAALPDTLLESELFGYEKGAFTGAASRKPGRVELAAGGTLFLDEIGEVTRAVQAKLLRLLQDHSFERLGGVVSLSADARFVAATHRNLEAMVAAGEFREDLFYRLNVIPITLPPLRERPGDVERIAQRFCATIGVAHGRPNLSLPPETLAVLAAQPWPGNVRQLQNFIERLIVFSDGTPSLADVERELRRQSPSAPSVPPRSSPGSVATLDSRRRESEREALVEALQRARGNRSLAARLLGVSRRTLYNKLSEHGLT